MNHTLYFFLVLVHILAATAWIGGMLFIAAVVVPYARRLKDRAAAADLIQVTGKLYKRVGHSALGLLILTGFALLPARGVPHGKLFDLDLWTTNPNAQILGLKLILFVVMVGLGIYHDIAVGPRATELMRTSPGSPEALRARTADLTRGRADLLLNGRMAAQISAVTEAQDRLSAADAALDRIERRLMLHI